eukprot:260229-Amphidinium_carterae.1
MNSQHSESPKIPAGAGWAPAWSSELCLPQPSVEHHPHIAAAPPMMKNRKTTNMKSKKSC